MCNTPESNVLYLDAPAGNSAAGQSTPRRAFLRYLAGLGLAMLSLPSRWAQAKKIGLPLARVSELSQAGGSKLINYKGTEILLVRSKSLGLHAINNTCTHKKCKVAFKPSSDNLFCKCHKSAFGLDGSVRAGPAPRPLTTYPTSLKNQTIIIELPDA